jgi:PAS domain-containing protein
MEGVAMHRILLVAAVSTISAEVEHLLRRGGLAFDLVLAGSLDDLSDGDDPRERCDLLLLHVGSLRPGQFERFRCRTSLPVVLLVDDQCRAGLQSAIAEGAEPRIVDLQGPSADIALAELVRSAAGVTSVGLDAGKQEAVGPSNQGSDELLDRLPHGIWELDRDGRITYMNRACAALLAVDPREFLGQCVWEVPSMSDEASQLSKAYEEVTRHEPEPTPYYGHVRDE